MKFTEPLQRYQLSCQANSAILGRYFCTGQQQLWRGSVNFKINSRPLFTIIFKLKNDNFKTRDFSPLIKRVITDVMYSKINFLHINSQRIKIALLSSWSPTGFRIFCPIYAMVILSLFFFLSRKIPGKLKKYAKLNKNTVEIPAKAKLFHLLPDRRPDFEQTAQFTPRYTRECTIYFRFWLSRMMWNWIFDCLSTLWGK